MNNNFWKGKRVLVTGDSGFKGAWLSLILSMHGAKVQGISRSKFSCNNELYSLEIALNILGQFNKNH